MPIHVWFINIPLNEEMKFLGVSGGAPKEREDFRNKLSTLCQAMGWEENQIVCHTSFQGRIVDRFPSTNGFL